MKKILKTIFWIVFWFCIPYITVWISYLGTGLALDTKAIFNSDAFWFLAMVYWFVYIIVLGWYYVNDEL